MIFDVQELREPSFGGSCHYTGETSSTSRYRVTAHGIWHETRAQAEEQMKYEMNAAKVTQAACVIAVDSVKRHKVTHFVHTASDVATALIVVGVIEEMGGGIVAIVDTLPCGEMEENSYSIFGRTNDVASIADFEKRISERLT